MEVMGIHQRVFENGFLLNVMDVNALIVSDLIEMYA